MNRLKQLGIGLLELMLALVIIALLIVMATRYYQATVTSQKVNSLMSQYQAIAAGLEAYAASSNSYSGADLATIIDMTPGLLSLDPWGGGISISAGTGTYSITFSDVSKAGCLRLIALNGDNEDDFDGGSCEGGGGDYKIMGPQDAS